MCLYQYLHQKSTFLIQIQVPQSIAKLAQLSPMKTRKRLDLDVLNTFATCAILVHDVTNSFRM